LRGVRLGRLRQLLVPGFELKKRMNIFFWPLSAELASGFNLLLKRSNLSHRNLITKGRHLRWQNFTANQHRQLSSRTSHQTASKSKVFQSTSGMSALEEDGSSTAAHLALEEKFAGGKKSRSGGGGGGGRGGRGGGGSQNREVLVSKALSKLLRHQAENAGIKLDAEGFAALDEVVSFALL
jgi:uncharacterized membrane protein YgcG